jgi:phosphatidylserine/phosphatidylglycerophosphate/cardiolipin synthase-like enzyme
VVRELFARAQKSVLVAGYSFDHGGEILEPLHEAMVKRDVHASFFVDIPRAPSSARMKEHIAAWLSAFFLENWRFPRRPELYYDPRSAEPTAVASLHAKCIVVDERLALVTSANFTDRGQGRNIEVGVLVEDRRFARSLAEQWRSAVSAGVFRSLAFKQEGPRP